MLVVYRVGALSNRDLLEIERCLRRAMALVEIALDDVLAEVDLKTQPVATVQNLADKSVAAAVSYASVGKSGIDLDRLRELRVFTNKIARTGQAALRPLLRRLD